MSAEEVLRWIAEHRLHRNSLARAESSTEWKSLSQFPEFSAAPAFSSPAQAGAQTQPLPVQSGNSSATLGLVLSCFSLICCGCAPVAILGIVLSCVGLSNANRDPAQTGRGLAMAGIIIGIIALLETVLAFALGFFARLTEAILKH